MTWGTVSVGRLTLRETWGADEALSGSAATPRLTLNGQESAPPLTTSELTQRREDVLGLSDRFVPVTFTDKTDLNGYYVVDDATAKQTNYQSSLVNVDWTLSLTKIGQADSVDIESRTVSVLRNNTHGLSGEYWHAPAGGHYGYYTGSTQPSGSVTRTSADGDVVVYRGVPTDVNPRWACALENYGVGRARVVFDDYERSAVNVGVPASGAAWYASNGLIKVESDGFDTLTVSSYDGSSWDAKIWRITVDGAILSGFDAVSVVRNDYELCTVRLLWSTSPGRRLLDLSVRRGSRFVECHLQSDVSATLGCRLAAGEAATEGTGYVVATSDDADGNTATCGSPVTFTADTTNCGLSKASVTSLSFYLGSVVGGSGAVSGDEASVLCSQYAAVLAESTMGVRR